MLDVPVEGLRKVADQHGFTILIGRAPRLHPDDIEGLIDECRVSTKAHASTGASEVAESRSGKSETDQRAFRPAQIAAKKLKKPSQNTSNENIAQLVPLHRT